MPSVHSIVLLCGALTVTHPKIEEVLKFTTVKNFVALYVVDNFLVANHSRGSTRIDAIHIYYTTLLIVYNIQQVSSGCVMRSIKLED